MTASTLPTAPANGRQENGLRASEAHARDADRGIVRLDPADLAALGARTGDLLLISGARTTVAKALPLADRRARSRDRPTRRGHARQRPRDPRGAGHVAPGERSRGETPDLAAGRRHDRPHRAGCALPDLSPRRAGGGRGRPGARRASSAHDRKISRSRSPSLTARCW